MKQIFKVLALAALVVAAASCSKSRAEQMRLAENIKIQCNPEVLALVGDEIPADLTVTYPAGYFSPKAVMVVTPVLVYEGGEQKGKPFCYQGEKIKDNYKLVTKAGGTVKEHTAFAYEKGVEQSHLELRSTVFYGKKRIEVPAIKVADGVICTQNLISKNGHYTMKDDGYQYVIRSAVEGQIKYDVNSANVKNSELRSASIKDLQAALDAIASDPRYSVAGQQIVAYASPEGGQKLNAKLSDKRAASAQKAWTKISDSKETADVQIKSIGQDWEGFQDAIENSNLEDKDLILRVLSMYSDPAIREKEIKNMSQVYTDLRKSVFPDLRRARFITEVDYQNFTDAELEELAEKAIGTLDETALLKVASNADNLKRKEAMYKRAADKFGSEKANFNLAALALDENNPDKAGEYLNKIKSADPDVLNAKGVCQFQKGNYDAAAILFKQAGTADAKANLGVLDILKGNYAEGASKLAGSNGNDSAVAYLLNGQVDKAAAAVTGDDAKADYIRAIIAARKGDSKNAKGYANQAAAKDPSLKAAIAKDAELVKYL